MMKDFIYSNTTKVYSGKDQLQHLSEYSECACKSFRVKSDTNFEE